jgi:hypothetical protein
LRPLLKLYDSANEVSLLAPELKQAATVRLGNGVAGKPHVEENAAVFEESCGGMGSKILFEGFGEFCGRGRFLNKRHVRYQFILVRKPVTCAV